jgi:hypothetical protein
LKLRTSWFFPSSASGKIRRNTLNFPCIRKNAALSLHRHGLAASANSARNPMREMNIDWGDQSAVVLHPICIFR